MISSKVMMISVIIIGVVMVLVSGCVGNTYTTTMGTAIVSLDRGADVHGSFVLGSGSVDSEPAYLYYVQLPDGGYKLNSVIASHCTIYQDENESPYIEATYTLDNSWSGTYGKQWGNLGDTFITRQSNNPNDMSYRYYGYHLVGDAKIHIPPNSIIQRYTP